MYQAVPAALFLDFDNVYSGLFEKDENVVDNFLLYTRNWIRWMERFSFIGGSQARKFIAKSCYINPRRNGAFCDAMSKADFRIVACPPLTRRGKTAADMILCVDVMDEIYTGTSQEIVIMSADADFTPLMERIAKSGKTPIRLAIGSTAQSVEFEFPENDFLKESFIHDPRRLEYSSRLVEDAAHISDLSGYL